MPTSHLAALRPRRFASLRELRDVAAMSLPVIVTFTSQTIMSFVDALMLARHRQDELAAVSSAGLTAFLLVAFVIGMGWCVNTFVSQSIGRGRPEEAPRYVVQAMGIALAYQALILPLIIAAPAVFRAYGHEGDLPLLESTYFRIVALRTLGSGVVGAVASFFTGTRKPVVPMITGIIANLFNFGANYLLIFGKMGLPEWGIAGAALGTLGATYFEALLLLAAFLHPWTDRRFRTRGAWGFRWPLTRRLLVVGLPPALTFVLDMASWTLFINLVVGRLGKVELAANNAASQIYHVALMPIIGLSIALTTLVGQCVGRRDIPGARRVASLALRLAVIYAFVMGLGMILAREKLLVLFSRQDGPLVAFGSQIMLLSALFLAADAIGFTAGGALKGAGDTFFPAAVSIVGGWLFFLPFAFWLARRQGLLGAWIAACAYYFAVDVILYLRLRSEAWRRIDIFRGAEAGTPPTSPG